MPDAPFRLIVAGSRNFKDHGFACTTLDRLLSRKVPRVLVISGGAAGGDTAGEFWAVSRGLEYVRFVPDWRVHGRAAGPMRNEMMLRHALEAAPECGCVVFWDGQSRGSADMIARARKAELVGMAVKVIRYTEEDGADE